MVTYWLQGKKTTPLTKNVKESEDKPSKGVTMETEVEEEPYPSIPGFLNDDLLMDPA